jgi:hypothetical protein
MPWCAGAATVDRRLRAPRRAARARICQFALSSAANRDGAVASSSAAAHRRAPPVQVPGARGRTDP